MKIKITAAGIFDGEGREVPIGTEVTLTEEPTGWAGRYTILSGDATDDEKVAVINPADAPQPVLPLEAKDQGGGWWAVTDATGATFGKKLRKDDAEAFNTLTDDEKVEMVSGED
ncbi:hypothetical protein [Phenylobacterium sp.]|uniref:hypothetical protein n=1 Tax=Phenylobacterium sp. TaxID=1871053 RepID=UPI002730E1A0|nr:hypothetical protein [Phenylobacterium sp.]MDP1599012.1 hypothetical protein [Phenylobacterium sp.]MDP3590440.1 hypothetical protein [Phenylobacterium sp.]